MGQHFNRFADKILDGHSNDAWIAGSVDVGVVNIARVVFRGTIGSAYDGDIAIDDVAFHNCGRKLNTLFNGRTCLNLNNKFCGKKDSTV